MQTQEIANKKFCTGLENKSSLQKNTTQNKKELPNVNTC